ncbi:hypothetical protein SO802_009490 [Lithocarpus litseifolius]|uniref:Uncharacterized protein n=1 Tax=Lithocarpus litseifolius TaxID=425828 RepID=A0AAW2DEF4_9ROSI
MPKIGNRGLRGFGRGTITQCLCYCKNPKYSGSRQWAHNLSSQSTVVNAIGGGWGSDLAEDDLPDHHHEQRSNAFCMVEQYSFEIRDPGKFKQLDEIFFISNYPGYQLLLSIAEDSS